MIFVCGITAGISSEMFLGETKNVTGADIEVQNELREDLHEDENIVS